MNLIALFAAYREQKLALANSTATQYRTAIHSLERFCGPVETTDLSADLVCRWLRSLLETHSDKTAKEYRAAILALWRFGQAAGLAPPIEPVEPIHTKRRMPSAWTLDELRDILAAAKIMPGRQRTTHVRWSDFWEGLFRVLFETGSRLNAALAIRPADVDLAARTIVLRAETDKTGVEKLRPISAETAVVLARLLEAKTAELFPWPYARREIWIRGRQLLRLAGLGVRRYHMFHAVRRASGSLVEAAGGRGDLHLGNNRSVFEASYLDRRLLPDQSPLLPTL